MDEIKKINQNRHKLYEMVRQIFPHYKGYTNEIFDARKETRLEASMDWIRYHERNPDQIKRAMYIALGPIKNYEQLKKISIEFYKYQRHGNLAYLYEKLGFKKKEVKEITGKKTTITFN